MPRPAPLAVSAVNYRECWTARIVLIRIEAEHRFSSFLATGFLATGMVLLHALKRGHLFIGVGLLIAFAGQFWTVLPIVTGMALIGRGAVLSLESQPRTSRQDSLIILNLAVYGTLVSLAIVAQSNAVMMSSQGQVSLGMLLDHAAAIVLLVGLSFKVFFRLSQPTT